jgi:hypothetical protein
LATSFMRAMFDAFAINTRAGVLTACRNGMR